MPPIPAPIQSAVLAVLRAVREAGLGRINRTTLIKLVYLLDCLYAETHDGKTASGAGWYFHSFGPFASDLVGAIDEMANRGVIHDHSGEHGNKEYTQYWLGEYPQGPSLADIGLGSTQSIRFGSLTKKFHNDLSGLLDHTYFKTLPMRDASPGRNIEFRGLAGVSQIKAHHQIGITDQAKLMKILLLSSRLENKFAEMEGNAMAMAAHRPIYDRAYEEGMAAMDADVHDESDVNFTAHLI
jgi:hypothetical protein